MSVNIKTITAPGQRITPENDGILRDLSMTEGWLNVRSITMNGSSFQVSGGFLIVGGRLVQVNQSTVDVPITGSGTYAYLVLTVDISQSASQMASLDVITSDSRTFPTITKERINTYGSGTTRQMILAAAQYVSGTGWSLVFHKQFSHAKCFSDTISVPGSSGGWSSVDGEYQLTQTLRYAEPGMDILVMPNPTTRSRYISSGLYLYDVGVGQLTWRCASVPSGSVSVNLTLL